MNNFPKNFLWGAATAAHQVEGEQKNDWSEWELKKAKILAKDSPLKFKHILPRWNDVEAQSILPENYISSNAVDHYHRYKEDIAIMKKLGLNTYRFSIEWSRVEPENGKWNKKEIEHYRDVISELKKNNIEPMITLWHRTHPLWIAEMGDWQNSQTPQYFSRFAEKMAFEYKNDVKYWITLNEPTMTIGGSYLGGGYPPEQNSIFKAYRVYKNMMHGHKLAYTTIHKVQPKAKVGLTHAPLGLTPYKNKLINKLLVKLAYYFANYKVLTAVKNHSDFLGIQYYTWTTINFRLFPRSGANFIEKVHQDSNFSDLGWEIYPNGIYKLTKLIWNKYKIPIIITENGIADAKDTYRANFIEKHIVELKKAISEGVDVKGYLYWSLLDNLEWDKGFWPKFGLVEVDRKTMKRTIRPSALKYAKIIKQNS